MRLRNSRQRVGPRTCCAAPPRGRRSSTRAPRCSPWSPVSGPPRTTRRRPILPPAVRGLVAQGCDRLYVKIDSTMRGSVAGQLRGALDAWGASCPGAVVVLCPAFPDEGRTVVGGAVLVDGIPVDRSPAAVDPITPVDGEPAGQAGPRCDRRGAARPGVRSRGERRRLAGPEVRVRRRVDRRRPRRRRCRRGPARVPRGGRRVGRAGRRSGPSVVREEGCGDGAPSSRRLGC